MAGNARYFIGGDFKKTKNMYKKIFGRILAQNV
jgi:hypothetical protein